MILGNRFFFWCAFTCEWFCCVCFAVAKSNSATSSMYTSYIFYSFSTERFWTCVLSIKYSWYMCFFLFLFLPSKKAWTSGFPIARQEKTKVGKRRRKSKMMRKKMLGFTSLQLNSLQVRSIYGKVKLRVAFYSRVFQVGEIEECEDAQFFGFLFVMHWVRDPPHH